MALAKMKKILIAGHLSDYDKFILDVQGASILHITHFSNEIDLSMLTRQPPEHLYHDSALFSKIKHTYNFIRAHIPKEPLISRIFSLPRTMKKDEFSSTVHAIDPHSLIDKATFIKNKMETLENENSTLYEENQNLKIWKNVHIPMSELREKKEFRITLGRIPVLHLKDIPVSDEYEIEIHKQEKHYAIILIVSYKNETNNPIDYLRSLGFEEIAIPEKELSPAERYSKNARRITEIEKKLEQLKNEILSLANELDKCILLLEYFSNSEKRSLVYDKWLSTRNSFIIQGWIREDDYEILEQIISKYDSAVVQSLEPDKDEKPPVAFQNKKIFSPFQLITRLYSIPAHNTLDPSPLMAVFFVIFFGITLTDAGYGLVLSLISLGVMWRLKKSNDLLWILFWGGLATVAAGLLTGGIFGDLLRIDNPYINVPLLSSFREQMLWFDPMKNPMIFFRLVLLLGVIHIFCGLLMGFYDCLKRKHFMDAIIDNFSWLVIIISLLAILFSSRLCLDMSLFSGSSPPFSSAVQGPAVFLTGFMALLIIVFSARDEKSFFFRFFIGFLKLIVLSGIFSYLGDVLSYIRLMALGMVTAGIGMAVNTIAFMMVDIPVVGILLTIAVMVVGHIFNLAINLLGGFVHTLRLQYVEFFSKFFIGGGKPFIPLSNSGKYIHIIE